MNIMRFKFEYEFENLEEAKKVLIDWEEGEFTDRLLNSLGDIFEELEKQIKKKER